jgi:cobalt-zinc-cadmium efflux system membrane fusion protein
LGDDVRRADREGGIAMGNRQSSMWRRWQTLRTWRAMSAAIVILGLGLALSALSYLSAHAESVDKPKIERAAKATDAKGANTVVLSDSQLQMINVGAVSEYTFPLQREAVGNIDFNEDMETQVFPPYQGRISQLFAKLGDNVAKGQLLFTIESPDLIQAESTLIGAAGVLDLTGKALERAKQLHDVQGIADKDLEQAISDQQTAEGALRAARDGVAVFGKNPSDIDRMVKTRTIDPYLVVLSPVSGRVTARNAAPGVFVQPGNTPAPYSVADISRIWLNASVTESDMPLVKKGQVIRVAVMAFPDRTFEGRISTVGSTVDPQLHRGLVRAEIDDPKHELLPGMFAAFVIVTGDPVKAPAIPLDGVVREGDGSMTVWVTTDGHRFTQRTVRLGLQDGGYDQVIDGVSPGERVVVKGAIILDNMVNGGET